MRTFVENLLAAATAGLLLYLFIQWRPVLPWSHEVRVRRQGAKWRRKVFSFGGKMKRRHRDTGR